MARFIGTTNEISGELTEMADTQGLRLQSSVGDFPIKKNGVVLPRHVRIILRPEKIRILRQRSNIHDNLIEGQIESLSYLGSRTEYAVRSASGR